MVAPISNDKLLPQSNDKNSATASRRSSGEQNSAKSTGTARPSEDALELSSAGRLASQEVSTTRPSGAINSEDDARALVSKIRQQIESAGTQAIGSHRQIEKGQLTALLESSAA
ncbi:hypothetical protein [Sedimenticola sp.]|uniref:hypothetical protein n=1 Tax=Sedimenticola sp. TaxID=1940285 RepID=UPI003D0A9440